MISPHSMIAGQTSKSATSSAVHKVSPHRNNTAAANAIANQGHNQLHLFMATPFYDSFTRFNSAEFTITDSELKAMAAAAMIGLRKPNAATGMPMLL